MIHGDLNKHGLKTWNTRIPSGVRFFGQGHTRQEFAEDCDINRIMARFEKTALVEHVAKYEGRYGDFSEMPESYQDAIELVREAEALFMDVPAKIRERFNNDPAEYLAFCLDDRNKAELQELGLWRAIETRPPLAEPNERSEDGEAE